MHRQSCRRRPSILQEGAPRNLRHARREGLEGFGNSWMKLTLHCVWPRCSKCDSVPSDYSRYANLTNCLDDGKTDPLRGRQRIEDGGSRMEDRGCSFSILHSPCSILSVALSLR